MCQKQPQARQVKDSKQGQRLDSNMHVLVRSLWVVEIIGTLGWYLLHCGNNLISYPPHPVLVQSSFPDSYRSVNQFMILVGVIGVALERFS
eukprot:2935652-Amphidinium_carterae.1